MDRKSLDSTMISLRTLRISVFSALKPMLQVT
jgi:hypothetical protein